MSMYRSGEGEPSSEAPDYQVGHQTIVEGIGASLVGQMSPTAFEEETASGKKVGERFAAVVDRIMGGEENKRFLLGAVGRELFRVGVVTARDGSRYGIAVARNSSDGDKFAIEPAGGSTADMARAVYAELPLATGEPDKVVRVTLDPVTARNLPQDFDGFVGPREMTRLEQITAAAQWGAIEQQEADQAQDLNSIYNVRRPFVPNYPEIG